MPNILTISEAANVLRCLTNDPLMLDLLPAVDHYIEEATGRDWTLDSPIEPLAKAAARMVLTLWHENPAMISNGMSALTFGLPAVLTQLEAKALTLATNGIPSESLAVAAMMPADSEDDVAITVSVVIVFNHQMASGATSTAALKTSAGATVTSTISLDATQKILTIDPSSSLSADSLYYVYLTATPDIYGQTITETYSFRTA